MIKWGLNLWVLGLFALDAKIEEEQVLTLASRLLNRSTPFSSKPRASWGVPSSQVTSWKVPPLEFQLLRVSLTFSHPAPLDHVGFPPFQVSLVYIPTSQCSCRSILGHLWLDFHLAEAEITRAKYLCKDWRSPALLRLFVSLIEATAVLLPGKCSSWTVLSPPYRRLAAGGRLQFPAWPGKGKDGSFTWSLTMASLCRSQLSGSWVWFISSLRVSLSRFRHAKNQISYDPTGKSRRLKERPPLFSLGVEQRCCAPGPRWEET